MDYHLVYSSSINLYSVVICLLKGGKTALHYGAEVGHLDVCELLLKGGAPADAQEHVCERSISVLQFFLPSLSWFPHGTFQDFLYSYGNL